MNEAAAMPGARLKAERERRGLSTQKAANELHLDPWVIEALEAGDYARIGPAVYAKGHLRKYAAMLTLPADELLADFDSKSKTPPAAGQLPLGSPLDTPTNHMVSPGQMLGGLGFVVLLAGIVWWKPWQQRDTAFTVPPANPVTHAAPIAAGVEEPPVPEPRPTKPMAVREVPVREAPVREVPARAIPTVARSIPGPAAAGAGTSALTAEANEPGAGRARLRLSFTADSWVDVRDAQGNKAYVGNGSANTVKTIAGQGPMHVYLRSGSGVQLEINGRVVAIGPQFFSGDVARFAAGADGVLRRDVHRDAEHGEAHAGPPSSTRPPG
jgi:cytoskeleton protein RodZ